MARLVGSLKSRLSKRTFATSVVVVAGGTIASQIVLVATSPVLTRMYGPADFGLVSVFLSIVATLVTVSSARYEMAVCLPKSSETAAGLVVLSLTIVLVTSALSALAAPIAGGYLEVVTRTPGLRSVLWLVPFAILGGGAYQVLSYWSVREKALGSIARSKLTQSISQASVQVGGGLTGAGSIGLIFGSIAGQLAGCVSLGARIWKENRPLFSTLSLQIVHSAARRYRRFPLVSTVSALLNSLGLQLPILVLAAYFDSAVVGLFGLTQRILLAPVALLSGAVGQVFLSEAATLASSSHSQLPGLFKAVTRKLFWIALGPVTLLAVLAPGIFRVCFGPDWTEAGLYARILAPLLLAQFVITPVAQSLIVVERLRLQLAWDGVRLVALGLAMCLAAGFHEPILTVCAYSFTLTALYAGLYFVFLSAVSRSPAHE